MDEGVVVAPAWLAERLDDPGVRPVDVRDAWEYEAIGHVPGAINVPFDAFRDAGDADRGTLPGAAAFGQLMASAGIDIDDTIVVYDDMHGVFAARFYVTAMEYGHRDVRLLDGDFSAWQREHPTTTEQPVLEQTAYEPRPLDHAESPLVDRETVVAALADDETLLLDTRDPEEFAAGHLPGGVQFDWQATVDDETRRLRPADELETLFATHGVTRDRSVLLYCNTARRISHTFVVLRALGFENVAFYEGSLTEWLAEDGVVETS